MYYYFPIVIAMGIATLNSPNGNIYFDSRHSPSNHELQLITQNNSTPDSSQFIVQNLSYAELMAAGKQAENDLEYLSAIDYFQQALNLSPEDAAEEALDNAVKSGFDYYMQAGYKADQEGDYQSSLQFFNKALTIKPDSSSAKKAIDNVNYYLSLINQLDGSVENEAETTKLNKNLLLAAIAATSIFSGTLLFFLFKKVNINLNEDKLDPQEELVADNDDKVIVNSAESAQLESSKSNLSSEQPQSQDTVLLSSDIDFSPERPKTQDTVLLSSDANHSHEQAKTQDTVLLTSDANHFHEQTKNQDTVLLTSDAGLSELDLVPALIVELQNCDREIRPKTIRKLSQSNDSRAMIPLVELIVKADTKERSLILEAMQEITTSILKPMNRALILSLGDENSLAKKNTIRDLTRMYEVMSQVTERLSQTINNAEEKLPETVQWALKQLKQMPDAPTSQLTSLLI